MAWIVPYQGELFWGMNGRQENSEKNEETPNSKPIWLSPICVTSTHSQNSELSCDANSDRKGRIHGRRNTWLWCSWSRCKIHFCPVLLTRVLWCQYTSEETPFLSYDWLFILVLTWNHLWTSPERRHSYMLLRNKQISCQLLLIRFITDVLGPCRGGMVRKKTYLTVFPCTGDVTWFFPQCHSLQGSKLSVCQLFNTQIAGSCNVAQEQMNGKKLKAKTFMSMFSNWYIFISV